MTQQVPGELNVKAAAQLSGVNAHALRAWERRYKVVIPKRSASGRRLYSFDDVQKLKVLAQLTGLGHAIGSIATLDNFQLTELLNQKRPSLAHETTQSLQSPERLAPLIDAIQSMDLEKLDRLLIKLRLNVPLTDLVLEILSPLLSEIGSLVARGQLDVAQEHLLSTTLRSHLSDLLGQVQKTIAWNQNERHSPPRLLLTTPEGDFHEFGILLSALLAGNLGFKFRYLGPNMPATNLAQTARRLGAEIIVIGSAPRSDNALEGFLSQLQQEMSSTKSHPHAIWIGGTCNINLKTIKGRMRLSHFSTLQSYYQELCSLLPASKRGIL